MRALRTEVVQADPVGARCLGWRGRCVAQTGDLGMPPTSPWLSGELPVQTGVLCPSPCRREPRRR